MLTLLVYLQTHANAAPELAFAWEVAKGVFLFAITGLLAVCARLLVKIRDDWRDLMRVYPALVESVAALDRRVGLVDDRHRAIDAVAEAERRLYKGEERRQDVRRAHDAIAELVLGEVTHPEALP